MRLLVLIWLSVSSIVLLLQCLVGLGQVSVLMSWFLGRKGWRGRKVTWVLCGRWTRLSLRAYRLVRVPNRSTAVVGLLAISMCLLGRTLVLMCLSITWLVGLCM